MGGIRGILYLNHALTRPLDARVARVMAALLEESPRDAALLPTDTGIAEQVLEEARRRVAALAGADPEEVLFTSGATESNNLAVKGLGLEAGDEIFIGATEHSSVRHPALSLEKRGVRLRSIPVGGDGRVDPDWLEREITPTTRLVAVMAANNEIGTLQPVAEIGRVCRSAGARLLVDAAAAAGQMMVDARGWNADLVSLSAHKFGGPRGVGALLVRQGMRLLPLIEGGVQEGGRRAGTENLVGIAGLGEAATLALPEMERHAARRRLWRERLWEAIEARVAALVRHGSAAGCLPGHLSFSVPGAEGESLLLGLRARGIVASSGSACFAHAGKPSHVLRAMGVSDALAHCSLLFSLGDEFGEEDIERAAGALAEVAARLRSLSPAAAEVPATESDHQTFTEEPATP